MKKVYVVGSNYASNPDRNWNGQNNSDKEDITDILSDNKKVIEKVASMATSYNFGSSRNVSIEGIEYEDDNEDNVINHEVFGDNLGYYADEAEDNTDDDGEYIDDTHDLTSQDYSGQIADAIEEAKKWL